MEEAGVVVRQPSRGAGIVRQQLVEALRERLGRLREAARSWLVAPQPAPAPVPVPVRVPVRSAAGRRPRW